MAECQLTVTLDTCRGKLHEPKKQAGQEEHTHTHMFACLSDCVFGGSSVIVLRSLVDCVWWLLARPFIWSGDGRQKVLLQHVKET
jgi:hypothetical protein